MCCSWSWFCIMFYLSMWLWTLLFMSSTIPGVMSLWLNQIHLIMNILRWNNCCTGDLTLIIIRLNILNTSLSFSGIGLLGRTFSWINFGITNINSSMPSCRLLTSHLIRFWSRWLQSRFNQILCIIWIWWVISLPSIRIIVWVVQDNVRRQPLDYPLVL